jgi:hypothetical protein
VGTTGVGSDFRDGKLSSATTWDGICACGNCSVADGAAWPVALGPGAAIANKIIAIRTGCFVILIAVALMMQAAMTYTIADNGYVKNRQRDSLIVEESYDHGLSELRQPR